MRSIDDRRHGVLVPAHADGQVRIHHRCRVRAGETLAGDAHDGERLAVDTNDASHGSGVAAESSLPVVVAEDDDGVGSQRRAFVVEKDAPRRGPDAENVEEVAGDVGDDDGVGPAFGAQTHAVQRVAGHGLERVGLLAIVEIVRIGERVPAAIALGDGDHRERRAIADGEGTEQERVGEAENRGRGADADG